MYIYDIKHTGKRSDRQALFINNEYRQCNRAVDGQRLSILALKAAPETTVKCIPETRDRFIQLDKLTISDFNLAFMTI